MESENSLMARKPISDYELRIPYGTVVVSTSTEFCSGSVRSAEILDFSTNTLRTLHRIQIPD